jgi:hypothetical protein
MSFSLCRLSWGFSALFISMTVIGSDASAQVHQEAQTRDYYGAGSMGMSAADQCYKQKQIDECSNLQEIQNTLYSWCAENDQYACEIYMTLANYEMTIRSSEMLNDLNENAWGE